MFPQSKRIRHSKGQVDHVDAWLMSYADLITLLFMLFVIGISVSVTRHKQSQVVSHMESQEESGQHKSGYKSGTLALGTTFDEAYRTLSGFVASQDADQNIALEKNRRGIAIDLSAIAFFDAESANIASTQLPALKAIARILKTTMGDNAMIEVEGHTDGIAHKDARFSSGWSLSALRAATIVGLLQEEGIDPALLRATSYGGTQPLVPVKDASGKMIAENRLRNQRIIIRLESPN